MRSEWGPAAYPMVPGHELVGIVTAVGAEVTRHKVGDRVGVGCLVGSCHGCKQCTRGLEQYCAGKVFTYGAKLPDGSYTYGGYSQKMVAAEHFVLSIPDNLPLDAAAPLLCAGITMYSPMKIHGLDKPGLKLGVLGLGGLGSMAVQLGKAWGCEVTVISTSAGKKAQALELGAAHFVLSSDPEAMKAAAGSLDAILDAVSAPHDINAYAALLDVGGKVIVLGAPPAPFSLNAFSLIGGGKSVIGSLIGGLAMTQEMLNFCAAQSPPIVSKIEVIPFSGVNEAYERLMKNDVNGRFVIDCSTL